MRRKGRRLAVSGVVVAVLLAAGATLALGGRLANNVVPEEPQQSRTTETQTIVVSASRVPYDERTYAALATRIVVGKVIRLLPAEWDNDHVFIVTPTVISVSRHVKGTGQPKELTIYPRGGQVGKVAMVVADAGTLNVGDEALFFLYSSPDRPVEKLTGVTTFKIENGLVQIETPRWQPESLDQVVSKLQASMRGEFHPTPTPTWAPPPTQIPSGGLYPPKPPRPVKPGE